MFLVSDGTVGTPARMVLVEREEDVEGAIRLLVEDEGIEPELVTVNPVGPPLGR
jgi:hypothetical protein